MTQFLSKVKAKVNLITTSISLICNEDIIYYILNRLSSSYQEFKTTIHTNLQPLNLDDFYSLLYMEESIQASEAAQNDAETQMALVANHGGYIGRSTFGNHPYHGRANTPHSKGRFSNIKCQICKIGHSAFSCWHCSNLQYILSSQDILSNIATHLTTYWLLDS